nr:hypothetical protein [uncultured Cohaesibacter sp.]
MNWLKMLIAVPFLVAFLNISGFCWSQMRYIPNEELISVGIYNATHWDGVKKVVSSIEEARIYLRAHPECCRIYRIGSSLVPNWYLNALLTGATNEVIIRLPADPVTKEGSRFRAHFFKGCCGKARFPTLHMFY